MMTFAHTTQIKFGQMDPSAMNTHDLPVFNTGFVRYLILVVAFAIYQQLLHPLCIAPVLGTGLTMFIRKYAKG